MKRKTLFFLLGLLCNVPFLFSAEIIRFGDLWYKLEDNFQASVAEANGDGGPVNSTIDIPETITYKGQNYIVTSIGDGAFVDCIKLSSITIPDGVTYIGKEAFEDTPWYKNQSDGVLYISKVLYTYKGTMPVNTSILIKDGIVQIGHSAFDGCHNLTAIIIPESVLSIENSAFSGCSGLTSVVIPDSVTSIGDYAFEDCSGLTSIIIPNSVTSIGSYAFSGCSGLTSVVILDGVTSIGNGAFSGCSGLTSVIIPETVTSIGTNVFKNTPWYDNLPDGVLYIGTVLYGNKGTMPKNTSIIVKDGTTQINNSAFEDCSGLTSIIIPNSVTSIGSYAFSGCSGLTSIIIPNSVTSIGSYAFSGCSGLASINIPDGVTCIESNTFDGCSKLVSITLPKTVMRIGWEAFRSCYELVSITIPENVREIRYGAFHYCSSLKSITWNAIRCEYNAGTYETSTLFDGVHSQITSFTFGDKVEHIPSNLCCEMDKLTSIILHKSVTSIGTDAFRGCDSLTSIVLLNPKPPFLSNSLGGASNKVVIVPHSAVAAYQSARYWKDCNISSDGFDINVSTTLTKAKITASYLGNTDSIAHRFGCIFGNDTVWQISMADSIVWQLEKLTPDSVYQFCLCKENGIPQKYAFRTKSPSINIDILNITQTTATMRFAYNFGDVDIATDVDCIQGHFRGKEDGDWRLSINTPRGTIDTTFTHLHPGAEYSFYVHAVLKNGVSCGSTSGTYTTLPVSLGTPNVSEYGQTYATINCDYNCGDATVIRNVLEFRLSAEEDAAVVVTENVTGAWTKVTNLLPNTTYYFRHIMEIEGVGLLVSPIRTNVYTFESTEDNVHWHFINGTQTNKWTIGTAAGSYGGGSSALYISGGTSYSYYSYRGSPEPLLPIWAYWDKELSGVVTISFDWKAPGSSYGYMRAYLVPVDAPQPTAGSTTVPEGAIQIGSSFNGQSSWTTFTDTKRTLTQQYHLYFLYDGTSWDQQYFAIDNVNVKYNWQEFITKPITLTTQEADGISNTSALLHGTVDCDQESYTEIGFEWKRSDAPATVKPQRLLVTDRVDENLLFRLEGLSSDRYYDFRTFCSYQGETYYGEWVGLLTSDKEVLVAPTVQTVGATANEQGAEMEGFIVTGTEPILQKGFEVWIKGSTDVKTTVAEGRIIRALIPEPWSYTTYQYKAYAKTASGTTYGETMEVTTGYIPRDVQDIAVTPSSNSAEVTWTEIEVADYYILTLFADEAMTDTVAVYQVGTDGSISRLRMPSAVKALVTCSIEDLTPATDYYFAVVAYNGADQKVAEESGTFQTEPDPTGIQQTTDEPSPAVRKILYRGQVLILRGDKVYTLMGQEAR